MLFRNLPRPLRAGPLAAAAILGALLAAYWVLYRVAFDAPFYFDTIAHLTIKTNLHMVEFTRESVDAAIRFDFGGKIYRPLAYISLALTHLFWGLAPRAYRIGNLLIHWCAGLALLFFFEAVLRSPRIRRAAPELAEHWLPVSVLAVVLWGLHPIQTNVVTYEIQRMASLCGLFLFLSAGAYLRARSGANQWAWGWGLLSFLCLAAAVASKENGVVGVPLMLLVEFLLLTPPTERRARRALLGVAAILSLVAAAGLAWKLPRLWPYLQSLADTRTFSPWERLLTQATLQPRYALLLLVPDARFLTFDADVRVVRSVLEPAAVASALAVALAVGLAVRVRRTHPLIAVGVLWFFAAQILESTIVPLELYYEHRLYIPSAFVYLGLAIAARRAWALGNAGRCLASGVLGLFLAAEAWGTYQRNVTWSDPVRFWSDAARKEPAKPRPYTNLGVALLERGQYAEAQENLWRALALGGDKGAIHLDLATAASRQGDRASARRHLAAAMAEGDSDNALWAERGLGALFVEDGRLDEAMVHLRSVLRRRPVDAKAWNLLGTAELLKGSLAAAEAALERAVRYDPTLEVAWNNLGVLHFRRGDYRRAVDAFERAWRLNPKGQGYESNLRVARSAASNVAAVGSSFPAPSAAVSETRAGGQ